MNFGPYFINCIKTLYNDTMTAVANNGHFSEFFYPTRGIRQGCPISANIFVIIAEIMASEIRQNDTITGIQINNKEYKISQYADDTVLYLSNENSLKAIFQTLDLFSKCSGLKANRDKCEALWIGASSNYRHKPLGIKWPSTPIRSLGINIQNDYAKVISENFNNSLQKIENLLKLWCLRKMTIKGKIVIINTLIISQLLYPCTVLYTPEPIISKYKKLILEFIWEKKPAKVKYSCLINSIDNGGLKLQDLETKVKSLKFKWIKQMINEKYEAPWKTYLQTKIQNIDINNLPYYNVRAVDYPQIQDKFYQEMFKEWAKVHYYKPQRAECVARELIAYNSHIKINNRMITYKPFVQNIKFIQNILNDQGALANKMYLENKYEVTIKQMQYNSLISAIPKDWKKMITNDNNINNYVVFKECKVNIKDCRKKVEETTTRDIYHEILLNKVERPTSENTWQENVGLNFDENAWANIYTRPYSLTRDSKLIAFQYKVTHRIVACKRKLKIWKIENSDICDFCEEEVEGIEHLLVACAKIQEFWSNVFNWWKATTESFIATDTYDIIFGMTNENNDRYIMEFNYLLLHGIYYVYRKKKAKEQMELYTFLLECKKNLQIEAEIYTSQNKGDKFEKIWGNLLNIL
jgi:hypothetical protein